MGNGTVQEKACDPGPGLLPPFSPSGDCYRPEPQLDLAKRKGSIQRPRPRVMRPKEKRKKSSVTKGEKERKFLWPDSPTENCWPKTAIHTGKTPLSRIRKSETTCVLLSFSLSPSDLLRNKHLNYKYFGVNFKRFIFKVVYNIFGLPRWLSGKKIHLPMQETWVWSLGQEDPLEKGMGTHSSILAWEILWTEDPGGLQSMGSQKSPTWLSD